MTVTGRQSTQSVAGKVSEGKRVRANQGLPDHLHLRSMLMIFWIRLRAIRFLYASDHALTTSSAGQSRGSGIGGIARSKTLQRFFEGIFGFLRTNCRRRRVSVSESNHFAPTLLFSAVTGGADAADSSAFFSSQRQKVADASHTFVMIPPALNSTSPVGPIVWPLGANRCGLFVLYKYRNNW